MIDAEFGFGLWRREVEVMGEAHRHQDLEINVVFKGSMTYQFGPKLFELSAKQVTLFWATTPHQLINCAEGTEYGLVNLPLANFLRYGLPEKLVSTVLKGNPLVNSFSDLDTMLFNRWSDDYQSHSPERMLILELELEAWLRRLTLSKPTLKSTIGRSTSGTTTGTTIDSKAAQIAQYISEHYQESLSLKSIAAEVYLNPSYAATIFKKSFGMTILDYMNQYKIANAQRLLATTNMPIMQVAFEAGFGSSSQFYASFKKVCGKTPRAFRRSV